MKIVLTGSLGHISRPVATQLIQAGHDVTVISHNPARAAAIKALGAVPAIGSIDDAAFLAQTFHGADAVYLMLTAANDGDVFAAGQRQAQVYVDAVQQAGVPQVVNLSSVGANLGPEVGALHVYHIIETLLTTQLPQVKLTFIRPTAMFYNLFGSLASIRQDQAIYINGRADQVGSWVAPADIAPVVVQALTQPASARVTVQYVASDEQSYNQIARLLGQALQLPALKVVEISDDAMLHRLLATGAPKKFTQQYVKMTAYERDHDFYADYRAHHPVLGPTKLADFAPTFAQVYAQAAMTK